MDDILIIPFILGFIFKNLEDFKEIVYEKDINQVHLVSVRKNFNMNVNGNFYSSSYMDRDMDVVFQKDTFEVDV